MAGPQSDRPKASRAAPARAAAAAVARAPVPSESIANLQSSFGNRALGQILSKRGAGALPPGAVLAMQSAAGNHAVQRMLAPGASAQPGPQITSAPCGAVQRLAEGEVTGSSEMSKDDLETFRVWLSEKEEIEQEHLESLVQAEMSKKGSDHPGVEVVKSVAGENKAKMLGRIPTIGALKAILSTYKERKAGTSRGTPVESKEQILKTIKASGLLTPMTVGNLKELQVLEWKDFQKKFREKDSKLEAVEGVSGFARGENVYIVQGSQTMFTALHEALHALSSEALQKTLNRAFNEGTTEWLTRTATQKEFGKEDDKYRAYDIEVSAVKHIADAAGISQQALAGAYFTGELEPVTSRLVEKYGPESIKEIFDSSDLNKTMGDLLYEAKQREKKKQKSKEPTLEETIQQYLEGLGNNDFTMEELAEDLGKEQPELLSQIRSRWQSMQSKGGASTPKSVDTQQDN